MLRSRDVRQTLSSEGIRIITTDPLVSIEGTLGSPTRVLYIPQRNIRLFVRTSIHTSWLDSIIQKFVELLNLPPNWNSYGARPINPEIVAFALEELLPSIMQNNTYLPEVVPTIRGGILLEWHRCGVDLEIEIISPGRLHIFYENQVTGETWEKELTSNFAVLAEPLSRLSPC